MSARELTRVAQDLLESEFELAGAAMQLGLTPAFTEVLAIGAKIYNVSEPVI